MLLFFIFTNVYNIEPPEVIENQHLVQEKTLTEAPVALSDDINDDECDREVQEILKEWDTPLVRELWDPEIDNPDRDRLFDPEYWKELVKLS